MEDIKSSLNKVSKDEENGEEDVDKDEEFYEQIEAPKFVDFTVPDPCRPDDRYWFCSRVGCDRKHEEEMDSEAIYKNFVLRVMAARSPNVRLGRALNSASIKCPQSAPAKPSNPRISKLAVISSISQKPLQKLTSTPKARTKQVASKYMTTPRNRKSLPKRNSFRTVQHTKSTPLVEPKNPTVAKALVFCSPKKAISVKTSVELHTPLMKICAGMKKLEITSQRKRVLGYSSKSSKDNKGDSNKKSAPLDPSRTQVSAHKVKSRMHAQNCKDPEIRTSRCMKSKMKASLAKQCNKMTKQSAENNSSDTEIDGRSMNGSAPENSRITGGNGDQEHLPIRHSTEKEAAPSSKLPPGEKSDTLISGTPRSEMSSLDEEDSNKAMENNTESNSGSGERSSTDQNQTSKEAEHESEVMDNYDKENASASDANNRHFNSNTEFAQKELGRQEMHKNNNKAAQKVNKNLKGGTILSATIAPGTKHKKPKPTNPKPFRLRTDERGILKEANFERKIQHRATQKESETISRIQAGNLQRKLVGNDIGGKESETTGIKEHKQNLIAGLNTSTNQACQKFRPMTCPLKRDKENASVKAKSSFRKTGLPLMQGLVARPHSLGVASGSTSKAIVKGQQLGAINENSPAISPLKVVGKPIDSKNGGKSSRGKRLVTIPKEPNFRTASAPKNCTRKLTKCVLKL